MALLALPSEIDECNQPIYIEWTPYPHWVQKYETTAYIIQIKANNPNILLLLSILSKFSSVTVKFTIFPADFDLLST